MLKAIPACLRLGQAVLMSCYSREIVLYYFRHMTEMEERYLYGKTEKMQESLRRA